MAQCGECGQPVVNSHSFCTNCGWRNTAASPSQGLGSDSAPHPSPWKPGSLGANLDAAFGTASCVHCGEDHEDGIRYCPQTGKLSVPNGGTPADEDTVSREETRVFTRPPAARPAADTGTFLVVHRGTGKPHRKELEVGKDLIIGRERQTGVLAFPQDNYLTPLHARFFWRGRQLLVEDLNTLNKVFRRIHDETELREGDRLRIGNHMFRFELVHRTDEEMQELTRANEQQGVLILGTKGDEARARLIIRLDTGLRGKEYFIGKNAIVIGREKGTHNFQRDKKISRRHAKITPTKDGRFILEDMSSRFGTWLQIRSTWEVSDGDEFLMGNQRLSIEQRG